MARKRTTGKGTRATGPHRRRAAGRRAPSRRRALVALAVAIAVVVAVFGMRGLGGTLHGKERAAERWRPTVVQACGDCKLDAKWADALLAAMVVESGARTDVRSVEGVANDLMQAAEGEFGWIIKEGWEEHGIDPETPRASVYAGVREFKQNLKLWKGYLGSIGVDDYSELQLVVQGYNFGADGWFAWCRDRDVHAYTVELAQEYSDTVMPAGAKGTPTHAAKWLEAYRDIRGG